MLIPLLVDTWAVSAFGGYGRSCWERPGGDPWLGHPQIPREPRVNSLSVCWTVSPGGCVPSQCLAEGAGPPFSCGPLGFLDRLRGCEAQSRCVCDVRISFATKVVKRVLTCLLAAVRLLWSRIRVPDAGTVTDTSRPRSPGGACGIGGDEVVAGAGTTFAWRGFGVTLWSSALRQISWGYTHIPGVLLKCRF